MMKTIKLGFVDFAINWGEWPNPIQFFVDTLKDDFDIQVTNSDWRGNRFDTGIAPDFVICAHPGTEHLKYKCPKIYFPEEPNAPPINWANYDYAMTYRITDDPRHHRLPIYPLFADMNLLTQPEPWSESLWNREFCCVLFGKPYPNDETPREDFFRRLCEYKKVHSAGRHLNNVGFSKTMKEKGEYIKNFKFVLSFESCSIPGFTTEKCFQPLLASSVPVYWGNPLIGRDFNTERFINCMEYNDLDGVIERMIYLDTNKDAYRALFEQPRFVNNVVNDDVRKDSIVAFFRKVFNA